MPASPLFLAVDIGTTTTKGIVVDLEANVVAQSSMRHSGSSPRSGWHEHDPEKLWWGEFVDIVSQMLQQTNGREQDLACVCVSGMWPTMCITDEEGKPLCPAILYDDTRSTDIVQQIRAQLGPNVYGYELVPRILWFKKNLPEIWTKVRKIFSTHSFVVYKLTGSYCLDGHTAFAYGNIFNEVAFEWDTDRLREFAIPPILLPPVFSPRSIVGWISAEASRVTGLKSGIPVVAGTGDTFISILGSGAHQAGDALIYYGSLGLLLRLTRDAEFVIGAQSYPDGDEGVDWPLSLSKSGKQLEWVAHLLQGELQKRFEDIDLERFNKMAEEVSPGASGLIFIHNLQWQSDLSVAVMPHAGILGLTPDSTPAEIYRALLEAFGYALRRGVEKSAGGAESFKRIFAAGGGAQSSLWRQIVTDILERPQIFSTKSTGAFGGALLAGSAIGALSLNSILEKEINQATVTYPQISNRDAYKAGYYRYSKAYDHLNAIKL